MQTFRTKLSQVESALEKAGVYCGHGYESVADEAVALVLGANDVVNPQAKTDPNSPLYGMPVLDVQQARTVFVVKRGMSAGYSGIKNDLFELGNTSMVFGDAKKVLGDLLGELKELGVGKK